MPEHPDGHGGVAGLDELRALRQQIVGVEG
jgi:hypothetical protein